MDTLDLYGYGAHYAVVWLRVIGLFLFVPIFSSEVVPIRIRGAIASVLAFAFLPYVPRLDAIPSDAVGWVLVAVRELSVGFGLGLAARMIFVGIEGAASLVAAQAGFALANMIDPTSGDQSLAPTLFQNLLAIALFLAADLHHVFIRAIVASYELLPSAAALPAVGGLGALTASFGARLFSLTVELAAPALVVTFLVDLVVALVGRAMPQVPILMVAYPLKLGAGLAAMGLLAVTTGTAIGGLGRMIAQDGAMVIAALGGR